MNLVWPMAFPPQRCWLCPNVVEVSFETAIIGIDGKLYGFRHVDCEKP